MIYPEKLKFFCYNQPKRYSLYHKISRKVLLDFIDTLEQNPSSKNKLDEFLNNCYKKLGVENPQAITLWRKLLSFPPNLEIGPVSEHRDDDPGDGFDPNMEGNNTSRRTSFRSNQLCAALNIIQKEDTSVGQLINHLSSAFDHHVELLKYQNNTKDCVLTQPETTQWSRVSSRWRRV